VLATVQVKPEITDLLAQPDVSIRALQPSRLELANAARDAAFALGWRFALGSLSVALAALAVYAVWRHRAPQPKWVVATGLCWAVACLGTAANVGFSYRPERLERFSTTGILGAVQRNADLLAGVETRAQQTTPYLKNLLALSAALQDKYAPQEIGAPVAARILLVSDVHGANQYSLMKAIVEQEQIDAVVDAGDLINFGSVTEAEAADLFSGIRSLGVPYIFVRGNHDAQGANDTALLDRLARVPNVVLLQPDPETYTVQTVNGVTIAGFNDPRWFGDDNQNNADKQRPAAQQFTATFDERPAPDVVVSHEPGAVSEIQRARLRVHGHMHSDQLEGNRIGVGTFTGGGPFSHFLGGAEGEELTGQPSSFDIAAFGLDCRLTSLTRYQFRNVVEGRPAYDDVTLINGTRIQQEVPDEQTASGQQPSRECGHSLGLGTEQVTATTR
jgi:predicted phosphodiesterase